MLKANTDVFFELVRAGLWETEVQLSQYKDIDYSGVLSLAEEQSVVGLVAAGLEQVTDLKVPKEHILQFVGQTLQIEQNNNAMNLFIGVLIDKMRAEGIYTLLVKGQGIAQCYLRPQWRSCGDVDFFLSEDNYKKAKVILIPLASSVEKEGEYALHLGMTIEPWVVELHGSLRCGLSRKMDKALDDIKNDIIYGGNVRSWMNGNTQVFLPGVVNDLVYVFSHILNHFYKGGIGLRQICDWSRLLWTYRDSVNYEILEMRIKKMGVMSEWRSFGAFAVEYLGLPTEALPFYSPEKKWKRKAKLIKDFVIKSGNFGQNRDTSYFSKYPYIIRKIISMGVRTIDLLRQARLFPLDSLRFFPNIMFNGVRSAMRGE